MGDKIPFYPLDLRNISRLVKTKTKTRALCLMVNTGSLIILKFATVVCSVARPPNESEAGVNPVLTEKLTAFLT